MTEMKKVKLDWKTRVSIILVTVMLIINSFNLIIDKIIQILVTVETSLFNKATSDLFDLYSEFCWVWLDVVTLANGIFFMLLFKNIALK
jgi:hypothetical protein